MITVIPRKITATSVNGVAVANDGSITLPVDSTPTSNSTNLVTSGGVKTELDTLTTGLAGKQNTLTFDSTPTSGSTNPVTSGGVYAALANGQNTPVAFGTCTSAAAEQNKVVTVSDSNWQLKVGSIVGVKFSNSNTYSATAQNPCTLNVNSSGAKAVYYDTGVYTGTNAGILGYNNRTNFYMYDGTYWVWLNTSYLDEGAVPSAYCTTDASTSAKAATCTNFTLAANSYVHILIASANTYDGAITLNINSTGAKPVYINGSASSSSNKTLPAGTYIIYYDGTNYYFRTDGMLPGNIEKVNGHTVGKDVPSDAVFTDTTYESKSAASGGTAVSLVTTGEKYTWNNKTDKVSGATSGNFAGLDANGNLTDSGSKASDFLTSHQDISGKVDKNQGVANAGKALGIGNDGMVTPVPFSGTDFTGATASAAGTHGYVPAPTAGDQGKFLMGNGTWSNVPNPQVMVGATSAAAGTSGLVPAPAAGDQDKVLKGGGAWATIPETANEMLMSSSDSRTIKEAIDDLGDVVTEFYLIIRPTFWTNSAPYLYTWRDSRVHADSYIEVTVENSSVDATADYIEYYKTQAGDGIVFKPNKRPTADLELAVTITNAQMHAASSIDADTVVTDAISGASSVDGALTVLNSNINTMVGTHSTDIVALKNDLGIVENGNTATHTISKGQYVIWQGMLYTADAAIASGTTLAASGGNKNLTAVSNGGLNALNNKIIVADNAGFHNCVFRGKNLGSSVTAAQWAAIGAGTFDDLFIGDYWTINGHTHTIVSFDPYWHVGDQSNGVTFHHLGVVSDGGWSSAWFSSNDTSHGYVYTGNGSIRAYIQGTVQPAIITDFGSDHVKSYRALYPTTYSSGVATDWAWADARVELLNEVEVYGCQVWGSGPYEVGHSARQLDLFRIDPAFKYIRAYWWLRSVCSAPGAALVFWDGFAGWGDASGVAAVRPLSLIG